MNDIYKLGRDALIGEVQKLKMQNAALRGKVAARDDMITQLSRACDACTEHNAGQLRRVADFGKRWAVDSSYGIQQIATAVFPEDECEDVPPNGWESQSDGSALSDWQAYNRYLSSAREHGKHDYQAGRDCNTEQYCKPELQAAYESGYTAEHELEGELS